MESLSRRSPRYRANLAITGSPDEGGDLVACRSRDVSTQGMCLDTVARWLPSMTVSLATFDPGSGSALELHGVVTRAVVGPRPLVGVRLINPPTEWAELVATHAVPPRATTAPGARRLRIMVIGDGEQQRGAMALYVSSGWDVIFAPDADSVIDAVENIGIDAVIAEVDARDRTWQELLGEVRRAQPRARRIVRGEGMLTGPDVFGVAHRIIDREDGLEALVDAITADGIV